MAACASLCRLPRLPMFGFDWRRRVRRFVGGWSRSVADCVAGCSEAGSDVRAFVMSSRRASAERRARGRSVPGATARRGSPIERACRSQGTAEGGREPERTGRPAREAVLALNWHIASDSGHGRSKPHRPCAAIYARRQARFWKSSAIFASIGGTRSCARVRDGDAETLRTQRGLRAATTIAATISRAKAPSREARLGGKPPLGGFATLRETLERHSCQKSKIRDVWSAELEAKCARTTRLFNASLSLRVLRLCVHDPVRKLDSFATSLAPHGSSG